LHNDRVQQQRIEAWVLDIVDTVINVPRGRSLA